MKLDLRRAVLTVRKAKPRGTTDPKRNPKFKAAQFPKGKSGNPGGKPKVLQRFAVMYVEQLMQPADAKLVKAVGLRPGATKYECLIGGMINAAVRGDVSAAKEIREVLEGRTITPIISAHIDAQMHSPEVVQQTQDALLRLIELRKQGAAAPPAPPALEAAKPEALPPEPAVPAQPHKAGRKTSRTKTPPAQAQN